MRIGRGAAALAACGLLLGQSAALALTGPDDHVVPCADFADMSPGSYTASGVGAPGSLTNPATFNFVARLWGDVNADVDGAGNPRCGDVSYTLYLFDTDPTGVPTKLLKATTFQSDQGTSPQTSFTYTYTWCPAPSLNPCTFTTAATGSAPTKLAYYVETTGRNGKTFDRAPELTDPHPYVNSSINGSPGGTFH